MTGSQITYAAPQDEIFRITYGDYQDENVYYHIDYIDPTELEEEGFWDKFKIFSNLKDGVIAFFYNLLHDLFVAFPFTMLKTSTTVMIWLFNKIYEVNFINAIVDEITSAITGMAGISNLGFGSSGLFGGFLSLITISVAIYTLYKFVVNRATISAFSGLLKSIIALTLAITFFANYSTIIKGLNELSVEASGFIIGGGITVDDDGNITGSAQDEMNTAIWNTFVHQPYLMLQYGSMNEEQIGEERILRLLRLKDGTAERYEVVQDEILNEGNEMMTRGSLFDRLIILFVTGIFNFINSIPLILLAFALIFFQFWFTVMAMIAPFAFLWSAFPNQFGVLARYFLELITPLVLKIAVSVLTLLVFSLTSIIARVGMSALNSQGLLSFVFVVFVQCILFFTLFLLRNRIIGIFSMGSKLLANVRENMSSAFVQPVKKGVRGTATAVGTVAGAMAGGTQGALLGSSLGSSIGQVLTGDKGLADTSRDVALTYSMYETMRNRQEADQYRNELQAEREKMKQQKQAKQTSSQLANVSRISALSETLSNKGVTEQMINETNDELAKRGISDITPTEIYEAYNSIKERMESDDIKDTFSKEFVKEIQTKRKTEQMLAERESIIGTPKISTVKEEKWSNEQELKSLGDYIDLFEKVNLSPENISQQPTGQEKYNLKDLINNEENNHLLDNDKGQNSL